MNPHHPGHPAAYPHHPSLSSSPHHTGTGGPHHNYGTGGGTGNNSGGGNSGTPDLPSPHSPAHGPNTDPATPYSSLQSGQGMGSNGHHHGNPGMIPDHSHHPGHHHSHLPGHPYPQINHNNNCTLKQEGGPSVPAGIQQCAGCGGQIVDRYFLLAMERYWHNGCLKCTYCGAALAEIGNSCFARSGMILCKHDYRRMFGGGACAGCGTTIPPSELVMRAGGFVFHLKCFTCSKCSGQLVSGDRFYLLSGAPVCETDWHKITKTSNVATTTPGNGGGPVRKGKVGRPRRSRE